jgi:hypothetical protein
MRTRRQRGVLADRSGKHSLGDVQQMQLLLYRCAITACVASSRACCWAAGSLLGPCMQRGWMVVQACTTAAATTTLLSCCGWCAHLVDIEFVEHILQHLVVVDVLIPASHPPGSRVGPHQHGCMLLLLPTRSWR